ncbi:MAG: DNA polymerase III subunit delta [Candidatus Hodarchaeota archaeon]
MSPDQFLALVQRQKPAPAYLFLGSEPYRREICRKTLVECFLEPEERQDGLVRHDLAGMTLTAVIDDARSLSLFNPRRILWVSNAEAVLPRSRAASDEERPGGGGAAASAALAEYLQSPSPDVVLVLDAGRYDLEGEDKAKAERVRKFYSIVPAHVDFPRFSAREAQRLAHELARQAGLPMDRAELDLLVESLGADALRIAGEIEKLRLYARPGKKISAGDLAVLVPDSSASTVFALVDALGRGDRLRALVLLDILIRQGEYLPLALNFLATLFRLALVAREQGLRSAQQIQQQLSRPGRPIWRSRAEQIRQAATIFSRKQLEGMIRRIYATDKSLRDARPDDRIVMENFTLRLAE